MKTENTYKFYEMICDRQSYLRDVDVEITLVSQKVMF